MTIPIKDTLQSKIAERIQEQLLLNKITNFKVIDGQFYFANTDEKARANAIIRDYLTYMLDDNAECLM